MLAQHVDALRDYLRCFPDLADRVKFDPLRVLTKGQWKAVRKLRILASGMVLHYGKKSSVRLVPEGRVSSVRSSQREPIIQLIQSLFTDYRVIRILVETDRVRYQSAAFLRALLQSCRERIAVAAAYENEPAESRSRFLVSLVLWWHSFAKTDGISRVVGLVPESWGNTIAQDARALNIPIELYGFRLNDLSAVPCAFLGAPSKVGCPYVMFPGSAESPKLLSSLHAENFDLDLLFRMNRWELCFRGLPVIWEAGGEQLEFNHFEPQVLDSNRLDKLEKHLEKVRRLRSFPPSDPGHCFYTFGKERWFESLLLQRHRMLNPDFSGEIYCQVPTWIRGERKVLDLLTVTREGRLAVLELKPQRDLALVFQGLEYWRRVAHHLKQRDFREAGYFTNRRLIDQPPLLYLVSPLFEFHRLLPLFRKYLDPSLSLECVGTNQDWKRGLRLLRRFELQGSVAKNGI